MQETVANQAEIPPRFIDTNVGWYVLTRESEDLGPYPSLSEAKRALSRHIRLHADISNRPRYHSFNGFHVHDAQTCRKVNGGRCAEAAFVEQKYLSG